MWYFDMTSATYGDTVFGGYNSEKDAYQGMANVQRAAHRQADGVERFYSVPYFLPDEEEESEASDLTEED